MAPAARAVAPDLIGFGQSGTPDIEYRFAEIAAYLDAFVDELGLTSVYLVARHPHPRTPPSRPEG